MLSYVSCVAGGAPNHYISLVAKQPVIKENAASYEKISKCRREDLPLPGQNSESGNSSSQTYDDQSQFSSDKLFKHFHKGKRHYIRCIPCSSCPHIVKQLNSNPKIPPITESTGTIYRRRIVQDHVSTVYHTEVVNACR